MESQVRAFEPKRHRRGMQRRFIELKSWVKGVYENDTCYRNGTTLQQFVECLWDRAVHDFGIAPESVRAKEDRRLLAGMQLLGPRHDLSSGQSTSERAA